MTQLPRSGAGVSPVARARASARSAERNSGRADVRATDSSHSAPNAGDHDDARKTADQRARLLHALDAFQSIAPNAASDETRREIQRCAVELLCRYDKGRHPLEVVRRWAIRQLRRTGQVHPPYDVYQVALHMGATVRLIPLESNGRLLATRKGIVVLLNADTAPEVQRFTLCHELAHVFFLRAAEHVLCEQPAELRRISEWGNSPQQEWLCDEAASELLMPEAIFRGVWNSSELKGMALAEHLARYFGCALQVTLKRLVDLGWRAVVTEWSMRERPGSTLKLRTDSSISALAREIYVPVHKPVAFGPIMDALHKPTHCSAKMNVQIRGLRFGMYDVHAKAIGATHVVSVIDLESYGAADGKDDAGILNLL